MPIRPELRHLYSGPAWRAVRERILARAGNACERCGKPHGARLRVTRGGIWYDEAASTWRDDRGEASGYNYPGVTGRTVYTIKCVITIAHLDHNPHHNADDNLAALCQHCHLKHDVHFHWANARRTRAAQVGQGWLSREIEEGVRPRREAVFFAGGSMKAEVAVVVTNRPEARFRYSHFETVSSAASSCPMCGALIEAHVPHACAKPDLDQPPHTVRPRCAPFESATFPFLVHRGMRVRLEGRLYRYTNYAALYEGRARDCDLVQSREHFMALVEAGVLQEVTHAIA